MVASAPLRCKRAGSIFAAGIIFVAVRRVSDTYDDGILGVRHKYVSNKASILFN